jgi:hypothetical protein
LLFTAYFDEADTHGPSPTIIMAGFLGHARQWGIFDRRLRALQRRDRFSIFHANEFKSKSGEFANSPDGKCMRLVNDLTELVRDNLTEGLTVHLERKRYLNEYRAPPVPAKMTLDSQYGLCFRACMRHLRPMENSIGYLPRVANAYRNAVGWVLRERKGGEQPIRTAYHRLSLMDPL